MLAPAARADILADLYRVKPLEACRRALHLTRKIKRVERLEAINKLLGFYGTEAIRGAWQNGFWADIVAAYVNTGETYALTVIEQRGATRFHNSRFFVSSMGDFVERNQNRLEII